MIDKNRDSGRTTKQMVEAPLNSLFVWRNGDHWYPKQLSRMLGRKDLKIVSPHWIVRDLWMGTNWAGIVVDHAVDITSFQIKRAIEEIELWCKYNND